MVERGSSCLIGSSDLKFMHRVGPEGGGVTEDEEPRDSLFPIKTVSMSYQKV